MLLGWLSARAILELSGTPETVLNEALLYIRIYSNILCAGMVTICLHRRQDEFAFRFHNMRINRDYLCRRFAPVCRYGDGNLWCRTCNRICPDYQRNHFLLIHSQPAHCYILLLYRLLQWNRNNQVCHDSGHYLVKRDFRQ